VVQRRSRQHHRRHLGAGHHLLNGRYLLYYAVSTFGSQVSAIGLATNVTLNPSDPNYQWSDQGIVVQTSSRTITTPSTRVRSWMTTARCAVVWVVLERYQAHSTRPATGKQLASNSSIYSLAGSAIEASYLYKRGGYCYLFVNNGVCCSGVNSTYNIRVGRSTSVTVRISIAAARTWSATTARSSSKPPTLDRPGQIGILAENGNEWFSYHFYDANQSGAAMLDVQPLSWTADGWPVFTNRWSADYAFENDARDDLSGFNGTLVGGASVQTDAPRGHVLSLSGANQYVSLPRAVANARTFTAWVKLEWRRCRANEFSISAMTLPITSISHRWTPVAYCTLAFRRADRAASKRLRLQRPLLAGVWTHVVGDG